MKTIYFVVKIICYLIICIYGVTLPINSSVIINDPNLYDVIVVGGGMAGLGALSALAVNYSMSNTLLIEGAERLGGRVYTIPFGSNYIELGAQVKKMSDIVYLVNRDLTLQE